MIRLTARHRTYTLLLSLFVNNKVFSSSAAGCATAETTVKHLYEDSPHNSKSILKLKPQQIIPTLSLMPATTEQTLLDASTSLKNLYSDLLSINFGWKSLPNAQQKTCVFNLIKREIILFQQFNNSRSIISNDSIQKAIAQAHNLINQILSAVFENPQNNSPLYGPSHLMEKHKAVIPLISYFLKTLKADPAILKLSFFTNSLYPIFNRKEFITYLQKLGVK